MAKDSDILTEAKDAYKLGIDAERDNRDSYVEDYRFSRLNEQWPEKVQKQREAEERPCLTIPRMAAFIRQVVNDARQNRPRVVCKPVDSLADPKTAEVLDGLIRNIEYASNAAVAYDTAVDCAVSGGFGYFRIDVEYGSRMSFEKELRINRIANPLSVVGDPYSEAADSSDWNSAFVTTLLAKDKFSKLYKGATPSTWFEHDYKTMESPWREGDEILIAEWWTREEVDKTLVKLSDGRVLYSDVVEQQLEMLAMQGVQVVGQRQTKGYKVMQRLLTGAEVLETTEWSGCYIPIIPVYGEELNIEGKRYFKSLINAAKDAQRRLNYWTSAATELVALSPKVPFIGEERAFDLEPDKWASVNTRTWSHIAIPSGVQPPQRQPLDGGQAVGAISQALTAGDDIKSILGMYDASLGQRSNETSGKAIMARQREGDTSTFHFIDNLSRAIQHGGRVVVDLIPYVYNAGMMVRILGDDGRTGTVQVENRDPAQGPPQTTPLTPPEQVPEGNPVDSIFDFGLGRYDVVVEAGPSYTTKREQTSEQLIMLVQANPQAFPMMADKIFENMDIQGATELAERFKSQLPAGANGEPSPEMQELQGQLEQMQMEAGEEVDRLNSELEKTKNEAQMQKFELRSKDLKIQELEMVSRIKAAEEQAVARINPPEPAPMQQ